MKLPWDEKYLKISFHIIFTLIAVYILMLIINLFSYVFVNFDKILTIAASLISGLFSLLSPLLIGLIIMYLLDPAVNFFQTQWEKIYNEIIYFRLIKKRIKSVSINKNRYNRRIVGVLLTLSVIVIVVVTFGSMTISHIGTGAEAVSNISSSISKTANDLGDFYANAHIKLIEWGALENLSGYLSDFVSKLSTLTKDITQNFIYSITNSGAGMIKFILGLAISIYLMIDKERIFKRINELSEIFLPTLTNLKIRYILSDIHEVFSGYIRGQLIDALIMGILVSGFLLMLNVQFAVLIGIFTGISNIIPYLGSLVGFTMAVATALLSGEPAKAFYVAIGIIILQQIDGMFIVPRVVGKRVELSPILVLLSLSIAGSLFGIMGMIFAVPVTAITKLFFNRYIERKKEKRAESL